MRNFRRVIAFTLAEVLIVLGVIGVVATLTIPALVNKYQEKTYLTQFKNTYAILYQAYNLAVQENGFPEAWGLTGTDAESSTKAFNILSKHLQLSADAGISKTATNPTMKAIKSISYKGIDGASITSSTNNVPKYCFVLANGAIVSIMGIDTTVSSKPLTVYVDMNGLKGPNVWGKDYFYFHFGKKRNAPVISGNAGWWINKYSCSVLNASRSNWGNGAGCAGYIILFDNMDYLRRDITDEEWSQINKYNAFD